MTLKAETGPMAGREESRPAKNWVVRNRFPLTLLGAWTCLSAILFALHDTATAAGFDAVWLLGVCSTVVVVALRETQVRERAASEALRKSEARFRSAFENTLFGMVIVSLDGRFLEVNQAFSRMTGFDEQELLQTSFAAMTHPDDARGTEEVRLDLAEGTVPTGGITKRCARKDGGWVWVRTYVSAMRDAQGRPLHLVALIKDLTDQKRAEEAARISEEQLTYTLDAAGVGLCHREAGKTIASKQQFRLYGLEPAEEWLSRERWLQAIHPEDRERAEAGQRTAMELAQPYDIEFRVVWPDGSVHWLLCQGMALDGDGIARKAEITVDITARKLAEVALAGEVNRRRTIFEHSRDGIVVVDRNGKVREANQSFADMLGYSQEEVLQLHVWDWEAQFTPDQILVTMGDSASLPPTFQSRHKRKDGSLYDTEISLVSVDAGGDVSYYAVTRDITERKRAEAYRDLRNEVLRILNEQGDLGDSIRRVLKAVKEWTGFDAVGIRLKDGDDFPYLVQDGFPKSFLLTENTLIERGVDGGVCRDKDGNVSLECTCGLVISGKTDPSNPLFTKGGSFATNDSFSLLDLPPDLDPRRNPRNQCMHHGYASLALMPIRMKDRIVGLLQLNDRKKGCFTPAMIEQAEGVAALVGEAMMRKRAEEDLLRRTGELASANTNLGRELANREKAEEKLRAEEHVLSESQRIARIGSWNWDLATGTLTWTPETYRLHAVSPDTFVPSRETLLNSIHPDDRAAMQTWLDACEAGGEPADLEFRVSLPGGSVRNIFTRGHLVRDADNIPIRMVGTAQDITERKRAEEALRENDAKFRELFDGAPVAYHELDREGLVLRVNRAECALLGYEAGEMVGRPIWDLVAGGTPQASRSREAIRQRLSGERPLVTVERRFVRRGGGEVWVELHDVLVRNAMGETTGMRTAMLDISERKRAEEDLLRRTEELTDSNAELERESAERRKVEDELRAREYSLSESQRIAHVGSWSWELPFAAGVCAWSPETYRVFGVSPDTFVPTAETFVGLIHPEDRASMQAWMAACLAGDEPPDLEFRVGLQDGAVRYLLGRGHLVRDAEDKPARIVGIAQDITERRRAEVEVRRTNEKLSASVQKLLTKGAQEGVLREMRTFLQACSSTQEIGPIVAHSMRALFPDSDGALFLLSPSKTDLETAVTWGQFPEGQEEKMFAPDACWGLRRGCLHVVDDMKSGLICPHMRNQAATAYACLPLTAKSDVIGLLNLRSRLGAQPAEAAQTIAALEDISSTLSEVLSLSISNLKLSETLRVQSIRDPLTGLFNRRYMEECLQREIWRASRNGRPIGVIMADIDHFKEFNDVYGHSAGDYVLSAFGSLVNAQIRGSDVACRYGGEEFTIILPEATPEDAPWRANELREAVKALKLTYGGRELGPVTISMGVTTYPDGGTTSGELLKAADAALYKAKLAGRDRVVVHGQTGASLDPPSPEGVGSSPACVLERIG